ncbi:MAG: CvpA family protein [Bacilli bacterium]|nr:CvpA family protein [Bacilli bacterium]
MIDTIIMIVNLSLWGLLALSLLFGFLRGFRRNLSRLVATVISIILAFILTGLVAKILGTINIGGIIGDGSSKTALDFIIEMVCENIGIETLAADSAIRELVASLAEAILRLPAYIVLLIVCLIIVRPILALIFRKVFAFLNFKGIVMRLAGMGLALVTHAIVFFFTTSIIFGAKGTLQKVLDITKQFEETPSGEVAEETNELEEILNKIDNQSYFKIVNALSGKNNKVQSNFLGHMIRIQTKNGTLNLIKEIDNLEPLVPIIVNINEDDIMNYLLENRVSIIKVLENSEILNIVMPAAMEVVEITMPEVNIDFEQLKDINWNSEKKNILRVVGSVLDLLYEAEFDFENPKEILGNTQLSYYLGEIGQALNESEVVKGVLFVYLNDLIQETLKSSLPENLQPLLTVLDLTKIDLENDLTIVGNVLNNLHALKILDGDEVDFIGQRAVVVNMIELAFSLSTIKGNEEVIIKSLIDMTGIESMLAETGITINYEVEDWDAEIKSFTSVIDNLLKLLDENGVEDISNIDLQEILINSSNNPTTNELVEAICESEMLSTSLIKLLDKLFETAELQEWESSYFKALVAGSLEPEEGELKQEILILLDVFAKAKDLLESDIKEINTTTLKEILYDMNESKLIRIEEIIDFLNDKVLTEGSFGIEKKFEDPIMTDLAWEEEIDNIIIVLECILDNDLLDGDVAETIKTWEDTDKISELLNAFNNSKIFRQIMPDVLSQVIPEEDYKTEWLTKQCGVENGINRPVASVSEWEEEIVQLCIIITNIQDIDLDNLDLSTMNDENFETLETIMYAMNSAKSFNIDTLVTSINEVLENNDYPQVLGIFDKNGSGSNEDEWGVEISRLIDIIKLVNEIGGVQSDSLNTHANKIGVLLNKMKTSNLFGNDVRGDRDATTDDDCFNNIIIKTITTLKLIKNDENPNGFINETKALSTDWRAYDWENEMQVLNSFDTNVSVQTDTTIKALASSSIIRDFYDIASIINDKVSGVQIYISSISQTLKLSDYVNGGEPIKNSQLTSRNWSKEIDDMNTIVSIFNSGNTTAFKSGIDNLLATSSGTLAVETAQNIKQQWSALWDAI